MPKMNLDSLMGMIAERERDEPKGTPHPVLAHTLRETWARYGAGNPFHAGQFVTPRQAHGIKGDGDPHVVLDVFSPLSADRGKPGQMAYFYDMRVVCEIGGCIVPFLAESLFWEPWVGEVAEI